MLRLLWRVGSTYFTPQGRRSFFKGGVRPTREDCEEKWRVVRVMKLESYEHSFFPAGAVKEAIQRERLKRPKSSTALREGSNRLKRRQLRL